MRKFVQGVLVGAGIILSMAAGFRANDLIRWTSQLYGIEIGFPGQSNFVVRNGEISLPVCGTDNPKQLFGMCGDLTTGNIRIRTSSGAKDL